MRFDFVSLHLDFLRSGFRSTQTEQLAAVLKERGKPCIVAGDFNAQWGDARSAVKKLAESCSLQAYQPDELAALSTFSLRQKRWDWILISKNFCFQEYQVMGKGLSDHLPVFARIARA